MRIPYARTQKDRPPVFPAHIHLNSIGYTPKSTNATIAYLQHLTINEAYVPLSRNSVEKGSLRTALSPTKRASPSTTRMQQKTTFFVFSKPTYSSSKIDRHKTDQQPQATVIVGTSAIDHSGQGHCQDHCVKNISVLDLTVQPRHKKNN